MKKSHSLIILGAAVLLLMGGVLYMQNKPEKSDEGTETEAAEAEAIYILEHEIEDISRVELSGSDGESLTVYRDGEKIIVETGRNVTIEEGFPKSIFRTAAGLMASRIISETLDNMEAFGLEHPAYKAVITFSDQNMKVIHIGNELPAGYGSRYAYVEGETTIYALSSYASRLFLSRINDIRNFDLLEVERTQLHSLLLKRKGKDPVEIRQIPDNSIFSGFYNTHILTSPDYYSGKGLDSTKLEDVINGIPTTISAKYFVDDDPVSLKSYGLDDPIAELTVKDASGITYTLRFGNSINDKEIYAMLDGTPNVFALNKEDYSILNLDPFDLVDQLLGLVAIKDITDFTVTAEDKTWTGSIEWGVDEKGEPFEESFTFEGKPMEEDQFRTLYQKVIGISIDAPNIGGNGTEGSPYLYIKYIFKDGRIFTTKFWEYSRDFYAAQFMNTGDYLVSSEQIQSLITTLNNFTN